MGTNPRLMAVPPPFSNGEPDIHIVYRLEKLEQKAEELDKEKRRLSDAVLLLGIKIENCMSDLSERIKYFEERKSFWNKVLIGIITAAAIGIVTHLLRISYIVQTSKLGSG